jgi:PadR family transcriptional regulator, regulatory protein PadR
MKIGGDYMPENDDLLSGLILELRRGTIILSVLSQLSRPMYGYSLVQLLNDNGVPVEANTLYPLLRRLEKQELLKSEWETEGSKPRKYYVRTEFGTAIYAQLATHWRDMVNNMNNLIDREEDEYGKE